ncbi:hypothetical protein PS2_014008 [Malus domestica]
MVTVEPMVDGSESLFSSTSILPHQQFGLPMPQQLYPQPINQPEPPVMSYVHNLVPNNPVQNNLVQTRGVDSEKMFSNKLQELEKQLLNDNDEDDECDADDSIGLKIEKLVASLPEGGFLLLPEHAKKLAALADLYVNDAFGLHIELMPQLREL